MKVFNVSDQPTDTLRARQLVGVAVRVGDKVVMPGESLEVPDSMRHELRGASMVRAGALYLDAPPKGYEAAKPPAKKKSTATGKPQTFVVPEPPAQPLQLPPAEEESSKEDVTEEGRSRRSRKY